jgi:hypothetical protein
MSTRSTSFEEIAMLSCMFQRIAIALALGLFLGCATTNDAGEAESKDQVAVGPKKKEKRCVKQMITGSRLPQLVCEGEKPIHNTASMDGESFRNEVMRKGRPTN